MNSDEGGWWEVIASKLDEFWWARGFNPYPSSGGLFSFSFFSCFILYFLSLFSTCYVSSSCFLLFYLFIYFCLFYFFFMFSFPFILSYFVFFTIFVLTLFVLFSQLIYFFDVQILLFYLTQSNF
jgi:hypothetical protein